MADSGLKARWVPDVAKKECAGCTTAFSPLRRRHHCRACGDIFCWRCSGARAEMSGYDGLQRVCLECSSSLNSSNSSDDNLLRADPSSDSSATPRDYELADHTSPLGSTRPSCTFPCRSPSSGPSSASTTPLMALLANETAARKDIEISWMRALLAIHCLIDGERG
eukprot:Sspe_Gene.83749::Locus_54935_Transcript_1_1_Confidence_1.000_Length_634::g.83749::m.83749